MSVTEIKQAIGGWDLRLREDTPKAVLDALTFFGHIAILPGQVNPLQYGDNLLTAARYVGVYRGKDSQDDFTLKGSGMAFWLGDEDDKGDVFETPVTLSGATFAATVAALLPPGGAITSGVINSVAGTYTNTHQWETPRSALTYATDTFGAEWRVTGDGKLDAGTVAQLYVTTPKALLISKAAGSDLLRRALRGSLNMGVDVEDTTTRVVLLAEGQGESIATGSANATPTPYKDIHGNPLKATRLVSESETSTGNAAARAQLALNRFLNPRFAVNLSSSEYDVKGTFVVGDYLDVYDPANGFIDPAREVLWQGDRINPMALRCVEMSWPIPAGWTVAFRDINGVWVDLSRWYIPESGDTTIVVGELGRGMSSVGGEPIGTRPNLPEVPGADTTIPGPITWGPFSTGSYQAADGTTKAAVYTSWLLPLNTDLSTITDGAYYEIRFRVNVWISYRTRWGALASTRWGSLSGNRWGAPVSDAVDAGEWHYAVVGWGQLQFLVQELTPKLEYEFQIRAVDTAIPAPHQGAWSASKFIVASADTIAPATPAAPVVAGSRIAIQVQHNLGRADGGTFNLDADLAYFEVHANGTPGFTPSNGTLLGKLIANNGMIIGGIPALGTFNVESVNAMWTRVIAVDLSGNKSEPSAEAEVTALLIDDVHISDLTVSKVTAGTIAAAWILAGSIKTATTGARVEIDAAGIRSYNSGGTQTMEVDSATGDVDIVGRFTAMSNVGSVIRIEPVAGGDDPFIYLEASNAVATRGHIAHFSNGATTDTLEVSVKDLVTDVVDGGVLWLSNVTTQLFHRREGIALNDHPRLIMDNNDVDLLARSGSRLRLQTTATEFSLTNSGHVGKFNHRFNGTNYGPVMSEQPSGGVESYLGMGYPFTGVLYGRGYMAGNFQHNDAFMSAIRVAVGSGFSGLIFSYPLTMTGTLNTVYSVSGTATFYHAVLSASLSSFQIQWSGSDAHTAWAWVTRTP